MKPQDYEKSEIVLEKESTDFQQLLDKEFKQNSVDITFDDGNFARCERLAKLMASGNATVPAHLRGNIADCFAIVLQTFAWGLNNPFAVAQKTHVINGFLGYEAQLVNAVMQMSGVIVGHFVYEYQGEGLELKCRVGAVIKGQQETTWGEWLSRSQVTTTNSPLWKVNPRQQMGYLQVKNWARAFYPGVLMGVYTEDELFDNVGTGYDEIKQTDLSTPSEEVNSIINEINTAASLAALELIKPKASLVVGEGRKLALDAFRAKKKSLASAQDAKKVEEQKEDTETPTEHQNNEPDFMDQYTDLRTSISECESLSDLANLLKEMTKDGKEILKAEIENKQAQIKGAS